MSVCRIVKLFTLGAMDDLMHYCIRSSMAPHGNGFDYTTNRHEITVYYVVSFGSCLFSENGVLTINHHLSMPTGAILFSSANAISFNCRKESYMSRVNEILSWFSLPKEKRPDFAAVYFDEPDKTGHSVGPSKVDGVSNSG